MKDIPSNQVVSVRLNQAQLAFLDELKNKMQLELDTPVTMATVLKSLVNRQMQGVGKRKAEKHQQWDGMLERIQAIEQRLNKLEG